MKNRGKAVIGVLAVCALLIAQQPVSQGPQAGNAAAWLVTGTANAIPQSTSAYAVLAFDLAATAATQVKASGGNIWGWYGYNPNTSVCFLQFYNTASATLGTGALHPFGIPSGGSFNLAPGGIALFNLSTGISTGQTTTATGATPCTAAMIITLLYD